MQIARWLLREPSSRDGDVGSGWGAGGSLPGVGGTPCTPGPSRRFLAVSVDTRQGLCPFSTLGLAPCLWGDVEGDRVEAGCSRPPGSPPASVLFGQQVFSLCRALGGTWWPSQNGQFSQWLWGPVTGSGSSWTWGPTNPTCSSLLKGLESQMGHPHPWLQQAFLTDSAPHLVFPRGSGQPPGEGGGGLGVCL